jgi:hypothetical protein
MMSSVFPTRSAVAVRAMQQELSFFAGCGWAPAAWLDQPGVYQFVHSCNLTDGARFGLTQRYASSGFYNCPWGPLTDQDVMFPIAVYFAATSSGDLAWLRSLRPALDAVQAFLAQSGLALGGAGPAVFVSPASGLADGGRHTGNWRVGASAHSRVRARAATACGRACKRARTQATNLARHARSQRVLTNVALVRSCARLHGRELVARVCALARATPARAFCFICARAHVTVH